MTTTSQTTELSPAFMEEAEKELDRLRATPIGRRIAALEMLLRDDARLEELGALVSRAMPRGRPGPGISDAKLNAVRQYMQEHGEARQVDVSNELEENSGSISLALRALAAAGEVEDTGTIDRKAKVWRWTGPAANGNQRATVVDPGEGVREGRRVRR